jgi:hypothetical protein
MRPTVGVRQRDDGGAPFAGLKPAQAAVNLRKLDAELLVIWNGMRHAGARHDDIADELSSVSLEPCRWLRRRSEQRIFEIQRLLNRPLVRSIHNTIQLKCPTAVQGNTGSFAPNSHFIHGSSCCIWCFLYHLQESFKYYLMERQPLFDISKPNL